MLQYAKYASEKKTKEKRRSTTELIRALFVPGRRFVQDDPYAKDTEPSNGGAPEALVVTLRQCHRQRPTRQPQAPRLRKGEPALPSDVCRSRRGVAPVPQLPRRPSSPRISLRRRLLARLATEHLARESGVASKGRAE